VDFSRGGLAVRVLMVPKSFLALTRLFLEVGSFEEEPDGHEVRPPLRQPMRGPCSTAGGPQTPAPLSFFFSGPPPRKRGSGRLL
jgi:hypothetical protein